MKKFFYNKIMTLILAVVMVLAMSSVVFADTSTVNVKVQFTIDGTTPIWGTSTPLDVPMGIDITQSTKSYFTNAQFADVTSNPLGTKSSVMDAIIQAAKINNKTVTTEMDFSLMPPRLQPGAYIESIGSYGLFSQYEEYQDDEGQWWAESVGSTWLFAYVTPTDGETRFVQDLSKIQLHEGDTIQMNYCTYDYTWEIDEPTN